MALPRGLPQVSDLGRILGSIGDYVDIPKINVPFTTIQNRAQIPDLSQDLSALMGINRIMTPQLIEVTDEFGPNGELVWRSVNDKFDQIRFVGSWVNFFGTPGHGVGDVSGSINGYMEVTFYGTGLNLLTNVDTPNRDYRVSIDGGAEGANITVSGSSVLAGRNYNANVPIVVAANLTPGLHTIRIRNNNVAGIGVYGVEVINEGASIRVRPGSQYVNGQLRTLTAQDLESFDSGFESGTLGTRGGRVVIYQKEDGSISKAVTPTSTAQLNLTSADHSNEEIARIFHVSEFGASRTTNDDWSSLNFASNDRGFTLDDGTTSLVGTTSRVGVMPGTNEYGMYFISSGTYTFTFVGTGLDFEMIIGAGETATYQLSVNGSSVGNLSYVAPSSGTRKQAYKIVSGLPYGTHVVRITVTAGSPSNIVLTNYIVYQPKTPTIPTGAKPIAAYNVMANYVANSVAGPTTIATGILRKHASRELTYFNGTGGTVNWSLALDVVNVPGGFEANTDRQNAYVEYVFFGTGFEQRFLSIANASSNITVSLQSLSTSGSLLTATTTNFPSLVSSVYGTGVSFNATTGILDQQDASTTLGSGFRLSGLTLGLWKVRFTNNVASSFLRTSAIDIVTPIHSYKNNGPFLIQNTARCGSQGIEDLRKNDILEDFKEKSISQAVGVAGSPTTTSTTFLPMPDMSVTHINKTGRIKINYSAIVTNSSVGLVAAASIYVNGIQQGKTKWHQPAAANYNGTVTDYLMVNVPIGTNKIDIYWAALTGGTVTAIQDFRNLTVEDA